MNLYDVTVSIGLRILRYTCSAPCRQDALEVAAAEFPNAFIRVWGV